MNLKSKTIDSNLIKISDIDDKIRALQVSIKDLEAERQLLFKANWDIRKAAEAAKQAKNATKLTKSAQLVIFRMRHGATLEEAAWGKRGWIKFSNWTQHENVHPVTFQRLRDNGYIQLKTNSRYELELTELGKTCKLPEID